MWPVNAEKMLPLQFWERCHSSISWNTTSCKCNNIYFLRYMVVFFPIGIISTFVFNLHNFKVNATHLLIFFRPRGAELSLRWKQDLWLHAHTPWEMQKRVRTHTIDWFHNVMTASRQEDGEKYSLPDWNPAIMTFPDRRGHGDGWRMQRGEEKRAGRMWRGKKGWKRLKEVGVRDSGNKGRKGCRGFGGWVGDKTKNRGAEEE